EKRGQLTQCRDLVHIDGAIDLISRLRDVSRQVDKGIADVSPEVAGDLVSDTGAQLWDHAKVRVRVIADVGRLGEQPTGNDGGAAARRERRRTVDGRYSADGAQGELATEI